MKKTVLILSLILVLFSGQVFAADYVGKILYGSETSFYEVTNDGLIEKIDGAQDSEAKDIQSADFDNDGNIDYIVSYLDSTKIYFGDGSGNFVYSGSPSNTNTEIVNLAVGDFDKDNDVDYAAIGISSSSVYLNDGTGTFTQSSTFAGGYYTPEVRDFDNDGDVDILMGNSYSAIGLFLNDGTGTFTQGAYNKSIIFISGNIITDDFDGDNNLDYAIVEYTTALSISLYMGDGAGNFSPGWSYALSGFYNSVIASGDLNGDGYPEIVYGRDFDYLGDGGTTQIFINNQDGTFTLDTQSVMYPSATADLLILDVDGDDDLDILEGDTYGGNGNHPEESKGDIDKIYLNDGNGVFTVDPRTAFFPGATISIHAEDFNNDGYADYFEANSPYDSGHFKNEKMYTNDGSGEFSLEWYSEFEKLLDLTSAVGDFDGDGDIDVVAAYEEPSDWTLHPLILLKNDGSGQFSEQLIKTHTSDQAIRDIATGDIDNDGDLDFVINQGSQGFYIFKNNGDGTFTDQHTSMNKYRPDRIVLEDYDDDGDLDLVLGVMDTRDSITNRLYVIPNTDGNGNFADADKIHIDAQTRCYFKKIWSGKFDSDNYNDLVAFYDCTPNSTKVVVYIRDPADKYTKTEKVISDSDPGTGDVADVDNDGDLDLIIIEDRWHSTNSFQTERRDRVYLNDGTGFNLGWESDTRNSCQSVDTADFNNDGYVDFVVGCGYKSGSNFEIANRMFLNDGTGDFDLAPQFQDIKRTQKFSDHAEPGLSECPEMTFAPGSVDATLNYEEGNYSLDVEWAVGTNDCGNDAEIYIFAVDDADQIVGS
ncbi:hypothetical protein GF336_05995, partial [Candidatus Woesearchaeota archaeon]|nr:hypothetical protein [Candidatus Woesearchaeota archaeon]